MRRRLLLTTSVVLVMLFSGHALFGASSGPGQDVQQAAVGSDLPQHRQLRERSARGLTEQGFDMHSLVMPLVILLCTCAL